MVQSTRKTMMDMLRIFWTIEYISRDSLNLSSFLYRFSYYVWERKLSPVPTTPILMFNTL